MTREEAISLYWNIRYDVLNSKKKEALDVAFEALREQEERSKGCEFCREDRDGFYQMVGSFSLSNPFHKGEYYLRCGKAKPIRIYDCPMCGRKLEVDVDVEA